MDFKEKDEDKKKEKEKKDYPNLELCIQALEEISQALKNGISLDKLELPQKLGMIIQ